MRRQKKKRLYFSPTPDFKDRIFDCSEISAEGDRNFCAREYPTAWETGRKEEAELSEATELYHSTTRKLGCLHPGTKIN